MGSVELQAEFLEALHSREPVVGLTHEFYRYPARFSPLFVRAAITFFTKPGDIILDPFMGGGTTLVEASALGRNAIGIDINNLAIFIARVKTTLLSESDFSEIIGWSEKLISKLNLHQQKREISSKEWIEQGYQKNISNKSTWPIRKTIELILAHVDGLQKKSSNILPDVPY